MQSKIMKKALSLLLSVTLLCVSLFTGVSVLAEEGSYTANRINIHPGIDDTSLNFTWQTTEKTETAAVRMKAEGDSDWTVFTGECKAFVISEDGYEEGYHDTEVKNCGHTCSDICGHEACTASQCYHGTYTDPYYCRVTATGLEYGKIYTYQMGDGSNWTGDYTTHIADKDPNEGFSYLVFGDSQTADQYYGDYMKNALELSVDKFYTNAEDKIDFIMNLGDNVHENNDRNYNAYYTAQDIIAEFPTAVVTGNHELNLCTNGDRINFSDHPTLALQYSPAADGRSDYWFRYGDVLFITFNSGPQQTSMMADLEQLIIDAKAAHPDTKWTILQTHQGFNVNNGGGKVWRKDFTSILSKYDIDLFFNGHHHLYSRTESLVFDSSLTCSHEKSSPVFDCAACSGSVEPLGEKDVQVEETFVGARKTTEPNYEEPDELKVDYNKTVKRYDPEGLTFISLDSLTAEGHDQYATIAGSTLQPITAYSVNTKAGQGAITKVTVGKDADGNDELKVETYWIDNGGTPRISNSADLSLLDDDKIADTPYDTYTIVKTNADATDEIEITFDGGSDRGIFTRKITSGEAVSEPANPVMTGKSFAYWTLDGETEFDFATALTEDTTLTAVYEDIPPTTTAELFKEAIDRGDSEIILAGDITFTEAVTFTSNVTVKSAEGQKYTITLDGDAKLIVAKGKKVTFDGIGIVIAATASTISDAYNNGTYITVGSGGNRADLYVYNCTIDSLLTDMGASGTGIVGSSKNASSAVRFVNTAITSAVTNTSTGGSILGQYITVYAIDTSMTNAKSGAWFCTSSAKVILRGSSSYVGWKHNSAKLYDFRNVTVKIARNKDNLIELSKLGSGAAVTNDNYKIYYAFEDTAFANGTAVEYTEPIADVDYETPVYATVLYTGTSYYGDVTSKVCGEYIEGVLVDSAEGFEEALANGDSVTLAADITLTDMGELAFGTDTVVQSKKGYQYAITLDGTSRLTVPAGKTVTFKNIDIIIAETSAIVNDPWTNGDKITVGSDNSAATLYVENCNIDCKATSIGSSSNAIILAQANSASKIYINNSTITSSVANGSGCLIAGGNNAPTFRITNSSMSCVDSSAWFCNSGIILVTEGATTTKGWIHSSAKHYDLSNAFVKAARNKDNLIELSKTGTGTAATSDSYKIYYSVGEDTSGKTTEYTEPIADIDYETPVYVTIRYPETSYYTTPVANICGEYIEGVGVATAEEFTAALANKEAIITLTADITLADLGDITIPTGTKVQSKTGSIFTITLDGTTRLVTPASSTVTFENINITVASTIKTVIDLGFENGWYAGGYIKTGSGAKLYVKNCTINCEATTFGKSDAAIIRPYGNNKSYVYIENSNITASLGVDKGALVGGDGAVFYITDSYLKAKGGTWSTSGGSGSWLAVSSPDLILNGDTTVLGYYKATIRDFRNAYVTAERDADGNVVLTKTGTGTAVTNDSYIIKYSTDNSTYTDYTAPIENISADTTLYVAIYYTGSSYRSTPVSLTVPEAVAGDVNGDKVVDAADLALVRQHIIGAAVCDTADVNGDGTVDILDLVFVSNSLTA